MSELYNKEMLVGTFLDLCPFGTTVTAESGTDTVDEHFKPAKDSDAWMIANEVIDYKIDHGRRRPHGIFPRHDLLCDAEEHQSDGQHHRD